MPRFGNDVMKKCPKIAGVRLEHRAGLWEAFTKWKSLSSSNLSDFIREAIREKIEKELPGYFKSRYSR